MMIQRVLAAAFAVGLLVLSACSGGGAEKTTEMRIAATGADSLPFMAALQVGIDKGWFKEEGIDASILSGGGGGNTLRVVTSGDADLAITGAPSVIKAAQNPGSNLEIVGSWFQVNDFHWITNDPNATLKGATLGFSSAGSATELMLKGIQSARPEDSIQTQAVGGIGDNWAAAKAGRITAGWVMHPLLTEYMENDGARILLSARDVIGDQPADLVAVNTKYAEANPDNVKAFFRAADRSLEYVRSNPEEAAADLAPLLNLDEKVVAEAITDTPEYEKAYSLTVDPASLDNLNKVMVEAGELAEPVEWSTMLNQEYLPEKARATFN